MLSPLQRDKSGFVLLPWRSHFWSLSNNLILIFNLQIEVYPQENISIFNKLFFYWVGLVINPKMRNLQEIIGFLTKNQFYLNLYALIMTV